AHGERGTRLDGGGRGDQAQREHGQGRQWSEPPDDERVAHRNLPDHELSSTARSLAAGAGGHHSRSPHDPLTTVPNGVEKAPSPVGGGGGGGNLHGSLPRGGRRSLPGARCADDAPTLPSPTGEGLLPVGPGRACRVR